MKSNAFTITALFAALTAFSALPAAAGDKNKEQSSSGGEYSAGASSSGGGGELMGSHKMSGTVEDIDKEKGVVDLNTDVGDLKLHFPPQSLTNVKEGDRIEVQLGFSPRQ